MTVSEAQENLLAEIRFVAEARDELQAAERAERAALIGLAEAKETVRKAESGYHRAQVELERAVLGTSVSFCTACRSMRCQCPVHAG